VGSPSKRQIRQHFWILLSFGQRIQDSAACLAHQVSKNGREFDVGLFQQLVDAIDLLSTFLLETAPVTR
jgi:hypothetical protein